MGGQNYKIASLKGSANYDRWSEDIRGILALDHCWLVTIGKEIAPKTPQALPEEKPAEVSGEIVLVEAVVNTKSAKDAHEAKMERYEEKLLDCDDKYSRACATIRLNCEDGPRVHIKGVESPHEIWSILKNQYESSDLATRDNAVSQMVHQTQSDFSTIAEYGEVIKKGAAKCAEMGNPVPSWLLSSFFQLGLNPDLEPYTFQMVNTVQTQKQELEINEMIIALVDHDRRQQFFEDTKALVAKKGKSKIVTEKEKSTTSPSIKKDKGKERCEHCGSARHIKKSCYYLMPANQRPVDWEPYHGKKHLLQEYLSDAKPTQSPRSMIVAFTVNHESKDTRFYLDSAAEVHMCYDRSLFSIYKEGNLSPVRTADHTELNVLGKNIVTLDVLVDGKSEVVNFCNILHAPELEYNLLSVGTIEKAGYLILAKKGKITVFDNKDNVALEATKIEISYLVNVPARERTLALASSRSVPHNHASWTQWHRRLGHLNMQDVKKLVRMSTGIDPEKATSLEKSEPPHELCESCMIGKQHRTPSRVVNRMDPFKRATQKGELSHGDIAGGGKIVRTLGGARYVFGLTDDKTDMTEIHLLRKKSEAFPQLKKFAAKLKAQGNPMQTFRSDNRGEFDSTACKEWMQIEGI